MDWRAGEPLARIAALLAPRGARGRRSTPPTPGCWLRDDVYAMHGHYSDRHATVPMLERLGAGAMARIAGEGPAGPGVGRGLRGGARPDVRVDGRARADRRSGDARQLGGRLASAGGRWRGGARRRARRCAASPPAGADRRVLGARGRPEPGRSRSAERRPVDRRAAPLPAAGGRRGGAPARRRGPARRSSATATGPDRCPTDGLAEWRAVTGATLTNTGCWVQETAFLGSEPALSPYRPGFAVIVEDSGPPALVNLLDG